MLVWSCCSLTAARTHRRCTARSVKYFGKTTSVIGIGSRCLVPDDFPRSFMEARRAMSIRQRSVSPQGAAAFDDSFSIASSMPQTAVARSKALCANGWAHSWITTTGRTPTW